jgi:hypothetical protein
MSTKIYTGLRIKLENKELGTVIKMCKEILKPTVERKVKELIFNYADCDPKKYRTINWPTLTEINSACSRLNTSSPCDYGVELVFFDVGLKNELIAIAFVGRKEMMTIFDEIPTVEKYYFWDNTGKPEDISEDKWEERKVHWDLALPGAGIPAENGLSIQIYPEYRVPSPEQYEKWFLEDLRTYDTPKVI